MDKYLRYKIMGEFDDLYKLYNEWEDEINGVFSSNPNHIFRTAFGGMLHSFYQRY